jgi:ferric-dicitrate binding protein FerR (iron transport regulator)
MTPKVRLELDQLLSTLCDGALDDAGHARLEEMLTADAECRRHYLEYIDLHARLLTHPTHQGPSSLALPELPIANAGSATNRRRVGGRSIARYAAIVVTTLVVSLALQWLWSATHREVLIPDLPEPVATLAQSHNCKWQDANSTILAGARLRPGEMRLARGLARIRFDSGSELVIEGPATIRLESSTAAMLLSGRAVFHADDTAPPFELHTPTALLVDLGTEYAVAVTAEAEEVHVFEGEVQRTPHSSLGESRPEHLSAGEARRFARSGSESEPAVLDPSGFVRQMPDLASSVLNPATGLLAYEGFDYSDVDAMYKGNAEGGAGWDGPWKPAFMPPHSQHKNRASLNTREGLTREKFAATGGCFDTAGYVRFQRRLRTPVNLGDDGAYYLSFLFRRHGPPIDAGNGLTIVLRPTDAPAQERDDFGKRLNIGVGASNQLFTHLLGVCSRVPLPLTYGETYLLVAKIVAGRSRPNQIMIRIYGADEPVSSREPNEWTATSKPFHSDLVFQWLEISVNSKRRQQIDEIRLGTSWNAVTSPVPGK